MRTVKILLFICFSFYLFIDSRQTLDHAFDKMSLEQEGLGQQVTPDSIRHITLDSTLVGIQTILSGLNVPWEIAWGPDNWIWFTEQNGVVSKVNPISGERKTLLTIQDVYLKKLGLLSMALHPDMKRAPYVFFNYAFQRDSAIVSRLVRYSYDGNRLANPLVLLEIQGNTGHNGSRIVIGRDGTLMWATGDISCCANGDETDKRIAQDLLSYNGKILRLNLDGSIPRDNPVPGSAIWASGFRVPQGLVYASNGLLYSAEHGEATDDEINIIKKERNYGYPDVTGFCDLPDEKLFCAAHALAEPLKAWTPTIAPAGIDYYHSKSIPEWHNSILMVTLKTQSFRVLTLSKTGDGIHDENIYLEKAFGRLRDICISPSGDIYISTSNRDWNPAEGFPVKGDDRILRLYRVGAKKLSASGPRDTSFSETPSQLIAGHSIYENYCASCHKVTAEGVKGIFPPLANNLTVSGDTRALVSLLLKGQSGKVAGYNQSMPAFNFLTDSQLSAVLTYIRTNFGNDATPVMVDDVRFVRAH
jgi:glucose/arabinose dehydrogenase/mono/diheme cytochrome c family protein